MADIEIRSFENPDETRQFKGEVASRSSAWPARDRQGHVRPRLALVREREADRRTESWEFNHLGYVVSGRMRIYVDGGSAGEIGGDTALGRSSRVWTASPKNQLTALRLIRLRRERGSAGVVLPGLPGNWSPTGRRGDAHVRPRSAQALRRGRAARGREAAVSWAVVDLLSQSAGRVTISNPMRTKAIASAKVKTDMQARGARADGRPDKRRRLADPAGRTTWSIEAQRGSRVNRARADDPESVGQVAAPRCFLAKLGIESSYCMLNALLYSVYGQPSASELEALEAEIAAYRNRWLDALLASGDVEAVVAFGALARKVFEAWLETPSGSQSELAFEALTHPTFPESSSKGDAEKKAAATKAMLERWNAGLEALDAALGQRDVERPLAP